MRPADHPHFRFVAWGQSGHSSGISDTIVCALIAANFTQTQHDWMNRRVAFCLLK
jgi:hypothetical protein